MLEATDTLISNQELCWGV